MSYRLRKDHIWVEANATDIRLRMLPKLSQWAISKQLTDVGRGEKVLWVAVDLLMCDRGGPLHFVIP